MDVSVFDLFPFGRSVGLLPMYIGVHSVGEFRVQSGER